MNTEDKEYREHIKCIRADEIKNFIYKQFWGITYFCFIRIQEKTRKVTIMYNNTVNYESCIEHFSVIF